MQVSSRTPRHRFSASLFRTPILRASLLIALTCAAAFAQQPRIDSISPSQGAITGGTIGTIGGAGFTGANVTIDRDAMTPLSQSDTEVRLLMNGAFLPPLDGSVSASVSGTVIHATVVDGNQQPAPNVRVDFAAPASGASCTLSSPFAMTDANGVASVSCSSNCVGISGQG